MKQRIFRVILFFILLQNTYCFVEATDDLDIHPGSVYKFSSDRNLDDLKGQKVGFLVEGLNKDLNIKRDENGYLIDNFLKNDSYKNINSGLGATPDFGQIRIDTPSSSNIASYLPSIFHYDIPYKIYELDSNYNRIGSGELIYSESEANNMCVYGFTRSIGADEDVSTKIDIYGVSKDGKNLIGKDYYNTKLINYVSQAPGFKDSFDKNIDQIKNDLILKKGENYEVYNYVNYKNNVSEGLIGNNLDKYGFSFKETDKTLLEFNEKSGNGFVYDSYDNKLLITNQNKLQTGFNEFETNGEKIFIKYKDIVNALEQTTIKDSLIQQHLEVIKNNTHYLLNEDKDKLYTKGIIYGDIVMIKNFLELVGVQVGNLNLFENYESLDNDQVESLYLYFIEEFLKQIDLTMNIKYVSPSGDIEFFNLDKFDLNNAIGYVGEINNEVGYNIYSKSSGEYYVDIENTLTYGKVGLSNFPMIKTDSGMFGMNISFGLKKDYLVNDSIVGLYNSIIGGRELIFNNTKDLNLSNSFGIVYHMNNKPPFELKVDLNYYSPEITDFLLRNDINNENDLKINNLFGKLYLSYNYFNNGKDYVIKDSTGKQKVSNKHPFVFPVSQIISKDERDYKNGGYSNAKVLKDGENSYFDACLGDGNIKDLYNITPESDVYTKYVVRGDKTYAITYKVLEFQFKYAGELSFGDDFGLFGSVPPTESINVATFMNTNPLKNFSYNGDSFKIESFLAGKKINIWSGFSNSYKDYSYGYRNFLPKNANVIKYTENGAGAELGNGNNYVLQPVTNNINAIVNNDFSFGSGEGYKVASVGKNDGQESYIGDQYNYNGDLYLSPACPVGYELYDDYVGVYKDIYSSRIDILEDINKNEFTGFFNTPKPFCIHQSLSKNREDVLKYLEKMFVLENNDKNIFIIDDYINKRFSNGYKNIVKNLFSTKENKFPTFGLVSEKNKDVILKSKVYNQSFFESYFGFKDYSSDINHLVDDIILLGNKNLTNNSKLKNILGSLENVYFSQINGINILKTSSGDEYNFSSSQNADLFPIVGAVMNIRKSGIDFYCKDNTGNITNSIIINGNCINKTTGNISNQESVYINYGKNKITDNGAFINNTIYYPLFQKYSEPKIPYTSGNFYLTKNKESQGSLPFISDITYSSDNDVLNLSPRVVSLGGELSDLNKINEFYSNGYGVRSAGFHFPMIKKAVNSSYINDFNNLVFNATLNSDELMECIGLSKSVKPYIKSLNSNDECDDGYKKEPKQTSFVNYIVNRKSNTIGVKNNDFETIKVPSKIGDYINKDLLGGYGSDDILRNKAELISGKPFSLFYVKEDLFNKIPSDYKNISNTLNLYPQNNIGKNYGGLFVFTKIDNKTGGLNNNSLYYDINGDYINETCIFDNKVLNSCVIPYYAFPFEKSLNEEGKNVTEFTEGVCIDENGIEQNYDVEDIDEYDINRTGYCNSSCTVKETGEKYTFSNNLYSEYVNNLGDFYCKELPTTRVKLYDGYTFNTVLEKTPKTVDLGKYVKGSNGNGVTLNSNSGSCIYTNEENQKVKCYDGFLSRYNFEIEKNKGIYKNNPGLINSYHYVDDIELGKKVSSNFNSVFNNDAIILTNKTNGIKSNYEIEGGYIGFDSNIIDNISGGIKTNYIFSDNDNLLGEGEIKINSIIDSSTKEKRQARRETIKNEIKKSSGNGDSLISKPTEGLNYLALKINKDDFYSLNGILRIAKDPSKYFSNLKIQDPLNEERLLNSVPIDQTIYSYNNLVLKYGDKFYTWGNNDISCNRINPNEVYNKVDLYQNVSTSREDTMTLCLNDSGNLTDSHDLKNDLFIILPIKPTKTYNTYSLNGITEAENLSNSKIINGNGYINARLNQKDTPIQTKTYFQGYFVNSAGNLDHYENFLDISNGNTITGFNDKALKGRSIDLEYETRSKTCYYEVCGSFDCYTRSKNYNEYRGIGERKYNTTFISNKIIIDRIPKVFMNGIITKNQGKDKVVNAFQTYLSQTKTSYSNLTNSQSIGSTTWRSPLDYQSGERCRNVSSGNEPAKEQVKRDLINIVAYNNQSEIKLGNITLDSKSELINAGNLIESFHIPEPVSNSEYTTNITYKNILKDEFLKSGNLMNNNGILGGNNNYVKGSLKENNYVVSVGDYLQFEHDLDVSGDIIPQQMFLKTQLDRGLDLDLESLNITINGNTQFPIYLENEKNRNTIGNEKNTQFALSKINQKTDKIYDVFNDGVNRINQIISINQNDKITTTKGKLFLEVVDNVKVYSSKGTMYIKKSGNTLSKIFETNNGIVKNNDYSDIFTDLGTNLKTGDVLVINSGEYARFSGNTQVKVLNYNFIPNSLLEFDVNKIGDKNFNLGIKPINSGFGNLINPTFTQPFYIFDCNRLENQDKFTKSVTYIEFNVLNKKYCGVYNKYNDNVFAGYLNQMTSTPKLMLPSEDTRFLYGDIDEEGNLLNPRYQENNGETVIRLSRGDKVADKEKQLVVNLGILKKGDKIKVEYKAKVNDKNYIGHRLYNYDYLESKSEINGLYEGDTLLTGNVNNKDLNIYNKSLNSEIFYLTHYGKDIKIFNQEYSFDNPTNKYRNNNTNSIKGVIEIGANIDLSILNLSGRKDFYSCNPLTEKSGNCDSLNSLETINKDGVEYDSLGKLVKKEGESKFTVYKGQKIMVRLTKDNLSKPIDLNSIENIDLGLIYDTNLLVFDGILVKSDLLKDGNGNYSISNSSKIQLAKNTIDQNYSNDLYKSRVEYFPKINNINSYAKINYTDNNLLNKKDVNKVYDFIFTARNTLNSDEIKEIFSNAYINEINGLLILDGKTQRTSQDIKKYLLYDNYHAFKEGMDYKGNFSNIVKNNYFEDKKETPTITKKDLEYTKSYQYYNIPFSGEYKYLEDSRNIITELNPNTASLMTKIVNIGGSELGVYEGNSNDGELYLQIELTNTSKNDIEVLASGMNTSLPNGITSDKLTYTYIDDVKKVKNNILKEDINFTSNDNYGKKILAIQNKYKKLVPGERITFMLKLDVNMSLVDLISTFTTNINIKADSKNLTLFDDTSINFEKGLGDLVTKSLPIFAENDVFMGQGFIKNKVSNQDLIKNNSGDSIYNVIGNNNTKVEYVGDKAKNKNLQSNLLPKIYDLTELLDENNRTYSVNKQNIENNYIVKENGLNEINLTNNTLYYFGDKDINIGDIEDIVKDVYIKANTNSEKNKHSGIAIMTKGTIYINQNIKISKGSGNQNYNNLSNIAFIGGEIRINPRVTHLEGFYITPQTSNSFLEKTIVNNEVKYEYSGNIGILRMSYSNNPLIYKGGLSGGIIINEREVHSEIFDENITSKGIYDFDSYISIPPVVRKK